MWCNLYQCKIRYWNILIWFFIKVQLSISGLSGSSVLLHKKVSIKILAIIVVWSRGAGKTGLTSHFSSVVFFLSHNIINPVFHLSRPGDLVTLHLMPIAHHTRQHFETPMSNIISSFPQIFHFFLIKKTIWLNRHRDSLSFPLPSFPYYKLCYNYWLYNFPNYEVI